METESNNYRSYFSKLGFWCFLHFVCANGVSGMIIIALKKIFPQLGSNATGDSIFSTCLQYGISILFILYISKTMPASDEAQTKPKRWLSPLHFLIALFMMRTITITLHFVGTGIDKLIELLTKNAPINVLSTFVFESEVNPLWLFVTTAVLAPIFEELLYRKVLIDRLRPFGENICILMSGLAFALIHGNIAQGCYTFGMGCFLAFIYVKTNNIYNVILLHGVFNAISSLTLFNISIVVYIVIIYGMVALGLILLIVNRKKFKITSSDTIPKGSKFKTVILNPGMLCFIVVCVAFITLMAFIKM